MTDTLVLPAEATAPVAGRARSRAALSVLPWLVPAAALIVALLATGTPARDVAVYGAYLVVGIALPGTLVHRAFRGSRGNLPEDIGLGAATGLLVQLIGWLLAAVTGGQALLRCWPLLIIAVFVAVPGLRGHWRIADPRPLPLRWSWLIAGTMLLLVAWGAANWVQTPLPPTGVAYYQDLMYHLALVHEMTRSLPFQVPQLAGESLRYHFLSDADMASASMITGVAPATVLLRLWMVPIGAIAVLVVAVLGRDLTGRWWAGPLAGAAAFTATPLMLGSPGPAYASGALVFLSPSQTYAMPLIALLVTLAADAVRERPLRWAWILVFPLALACAGAKESSVPPLLAGLIVAVLVAVRQRRRVPWPLAAVLGLTLAAVGGGLLLFAGGGAGVLGFQPLSALTWMPPYRLTLGAFDGFGRDPIPPGVAHAGVGGGLFIAGLIVWWLLMQSPRLLGLVALITRPSRTDPMMWLLAGMICSGTGASWLLWHPSSSQIYFVSGALPFGALLTVKLLADQVRWWPVPVLGLLSGALWVLAVPAPGTPQRRVEAWAVALAEPLLWTAIAVVVASLLCVVVVRVLRKRRPTLAWARPRPAATWARRLAVALVAASLGGSIASAGRQWTTGLQGAESTIASASFQAGTKAEMAAALWLDQHAGNDDVVATNVHCKPYRPEGQCDARAFWVAGLAGRRTVVESWGYSDATIAASGVNGIRYNFQPPPDRAVYDLNERVFTRGDAASLAELQRLYHVRWLLADHRAGAVSPALTTLATVRLVSGPVTIYEISKP